MNNDSILDSTKKTLGIGVGYSAFDLDIINAINTALATLSQVGVGPEEGFEIEGSSTTWGNLLGGDRRLNNVRSYVLLQCRLLFDPPQTSFGIQAQKDQLAEMIWRIQLAADPPPPAQDK